MPLVNPGPNPLSFFWTFFGHSYFNGSYGAHGPAGRADSIMRSLFAMEQVSQTKNHAVVGAKATWNGLSQGGWTRLIQNQRGNTYNPGYPDVAYDGAFFLGWGINDLGIHGSTVQNNTAYQHAIRTCISRCRAARTWNADAPQFIYGAGFLVQNYQWETCAGNNYYKAITTTAATISWTIPADFKGGTIAFMFMARVGVQGATWTWGGTAGVTGTTSTSNILPAGSGAVMSPVVRRITNLTTANAGQTITIAATAIDAAGGSADFGGCWIESPWPPPVLVPNTARLTATGYTAYALTFTATGLSATAVASTPATITLASGTTIGLSTAGSVTIPSAGGTVTLSYTGTTPTTITGVTHAGGSGNYSSNVLSWAGPTDADVVAFNTYLTALIPEFDGMLQMVDMDTAINKDAVSLGTDGLHPSELGAARIADAFRIAANRLTPSSIYGEASQVNVPNKSLAPLYQPRFSGGWYTTPGTAIGGTPYVPVVGDMFAIPMNVTNQQETWYRWSVETLGGTVAATIRFGVYDDRAYSGMPKHLFNSPVTTPITLPVGAGVFNSTTSNGTSGFFILGADPGLYWLTILIVTAGTGVTMRTLKGPSVLMPQLTTTGGAATTQCGWKLTGRVTTGMPISWDFPFDPGLNVMVDNCPLIGVQVF